MQLPASPVSLVAGLRRFIDRSLTLPAAEMDAAFSALALELFAFQYSSNLLYRRWCDSRQRTPVQITRWEDIPAVPTSAFKELEWTSIPASEHTHVFHSSGTTTQQPSRHFHHSESLALYETSLLAWFDRCVTPRLPQPVRMLALTPGPQAAPHSSLVHMFDALQKHLGTPDSAFFGGLTSDSAWDINVPCALSALAEVIAATKPVFIVGTAFSFVHLLDTMVEQNLRLPLPAGSLVLETGGYKGRSRALPKEELHALITQYLGVPASHIVVEYGMSELSSQGYDSFDAAGRRCFQFPPWARAVLISPETGRPVADGETGLVRVYDLANVWSVMALQTDDLAIRRGDRFELLGRAALAEPRGCSLMAT